MGYVALFIPMIALSIPIIAIVLRHRQKAQMNKIRELELQRDILELEVKKQDSKIRLLEAENKNLDKILEKS